jgi:hypothetical protein
MMASSDVENGEFVEKGFRGHTEFQFGLRD